MTGAQFEIRIDGTPRSYRDRKDYAMEAARLIKSKNPHSMVEVKDLQSGDVAAVALRPVMWCSAKRVSLAPKALCRSGGDRATGRLAEVQESGSTAMK